jgi:hypothetical protein
LLHQAHGVGNAPMFSGLAVLDANDVDRFEFYGLAGRGDAGSPTDETVRPGSRDAFVPARPVAYAAAAGSSTNTSTAKSGSTWFWLMKAITFRSSWRSTIPTSSSRMTSW